MLVFPKRAAPPDIVVPLCEVLRELDYQYERIARVHLET